MFAIRLEKLKSKVLATTRCICNINFINYEKNLPIVVFDMNTKGNLEKVITGENIGTKVDK